MDREEMEVDHVSASFFSSDWYQIFS